MKKELRNVLEIVIVLVLSVIIYESQAYGLPSWWYGLPELRSELVVANVLIIGKVVLFG